MVYIYDSEEEHGKPLITWLSLDEFKEAIFDAVCDGCQIPCHGCEKISKDDAYAYVCDNPPDRGP